MKWEACSGDDSKLFFNSSTCIETNKFLKKGDEREKRADGKLDFKRKHMITAYDPMIIVIFRKEIEN